jgi:hypothetical protein
MGSPHHDAGILYPDGYVPGRYGHARNRGTTLYPLGHLTRIQSYLVWSSLYCNLPDRLHDATVWIQSFSDESDGSKRDYPGRYLQLYRSFCHNYVDRLMPGHDVSTDCFVVTSNIFCTMMGADEVF